MKMELTLESHSTWYGGEIENAFNNSVWMSLHDERYNKSDLEQMVKTGIPFNVELTFKSGLGSSKTRLILQEYRG